jgi:hypothetical protein
VSAIILLVSHPQFGYYQPQSVGRNGMAIASFTFGVISLVLLPGFLISAIMLPATGFPIWFVLGALLPGTFGLIALSQIKRRGDYGRGMAIAGVVLATISLVAMAVLAVYGLTP